MIFRNKSFIKNIILQRIFHLKIFLNWNLNHLNY